MTSRTDRLDRRLRVATESRGLISIVGIGHVDQMVDDDSTRLGTRLAGRHVHAAVDLPRIGADDLDRHSSRQRRRHRSLPHTGRPGDHDQRPLHALTHFS